VLGKVDAARRIVAELRTRVGRHVAVFEPQLRLTEGWLAAAEGTVSLAVEKALDAAHLAAESGQHGFELLALHDAVRFGDRECIPRLLELTTTVGGALSEAYRAHATAVVESRPDGVLEAAEHFERLGALLSAADAFADASTLYRAADNRRQAVDAAAQADRLAGMCGGIRTPALKIAANPLPISAREREIAELIAAGASNKQIAERLVLSVRTVEGHIYRACAKVGVGDRDALGHVVTRG
jgi:ATP/maltotriose-dependent transcriptional regulator MalT